MRKPIRVLFMKIRKVPVIGLSALLVVAAGCGANKVTPASSGTDSPEADSSSVVSEAPSSSVPAPDSSSAITSGSEKTSSESASPAKPIIPKSESKPQDDNGWVAYDTNKDGYKLHIRRKDGTGDKVIVNDIVLAPCVAGKWVYYLPDLGEIDKVKLDGSQKTKVCGTDAIQVYNVNLNAYHGLNGSTSITAEYRDGSILYTCFQLHEVGDKPNPPSYYKLDLKQNKLIPVKN